MSTGVLSKKQWRFESIDLRAGMGIALWRHQRGAAHVLPPDHAPALFFSPPHFRPEPLVNISVALSACRATFEPGLYLDEYDNVEVSFNTPDEVSEFLRRAYVSGAGGDGGDGGDLAPVPPPPVNDDGDRDRAGSPTEFESSMIDDLEQGISKFRVVARSLELGASAQFSWSKSVSLDESSQADMRSTPANNAAALATAGLAVLSEILGRMPDRTDDALLLRWHDDVRMLSAMLSKLGVVGLLATFRYGADLREILLKCPFVQLNSLDDDERYELGLLLLFGPPIDPFQSDDQVRFFLHEHLNWHYRPRGTWPSHTGVTKECDPLDALMRLPLPRVLHAILSEDVRDQASLYHLLNVFVSEPQSVAHYPRLAACVALFAAACITAPQRAYYYHFNWSRLSGPSDESARWAVEDAYTWLLEHMPQRVFAENYEAILRKVKAIRYFVSE